MGGLESDEEVLGRVAGVVMYDGYEVNEGDKGMVV